MSRYLATVIAIALLPSVAFVGAAPRPEVPPGEVTTRDTASTWSFGKATVSYSISEETIALTPGWADPESSDPPLSIQQAISASRQVLARHFPVAVNWELSGVGLEFFGNRDRWYYVVTWQGSNGSEDGAVHVPVLMNGIAVDLEVKGH